MGSFFKWRAVFTGVLIALAALVVSPAEAARGRARSHHTKHVEKKHHGRDHAHARAKPHGPKPHAHAKSKTHGKPAKHAKHAKPRAKR